MKRSGKANIHIAIGMLVVFGGSFLAPPAFGGHFPWDLGHDIFTPETPPEEPPEQDPDCNDEGSPFKVATGNYTYRYQDFSANVLGPEISFTRTYNSQDRRNGPLGAGWAHSYDVRLLDLTDGVVVSAVCRKGTGERFRFERNPGGSYSPPPDFFSELTQLGDGTFSLEEADGTTKLFDADGLLTAIEDLEGNQLSLTYDATGFLVSITSAAGGQIQLTKGANGKIASITDPLGRVFEYAYDVEGRLTVVTDSADDTTTYVYGVDGKLAQILDSLGRTVQDLAYDAEGRLTGYIEDGVSWTVAYTPGESKTTKTNSLGEVFTVFYNENGNVVERIDPLGGRQTFTYDGSFRMTASTDESNQPVSYTYDARGNIASQTDALGNTTTWVYDQATGELLSVTNPEAETTTFTYDSGRLIQVEDDEGLLLQVEYYANGLVHRTIDPNGQATVFVYNAQGLPTSVTTPEGGQTTLEYDGAGNQTAVVDPDGRRREFVYDELNRVIVERDPAGNETTFTYAPACPMCPAQSRLASRVDGSGRETRWEYDQYGRPTKMIFPDLTEAQFTYDARGSLASSIERDGSVTLYTYDALRRLETVQTPGAGISTATYDSAGHVVGFVDAGGAATTFLPDPLGRLAQVTAGEAGPASAAYTPAGRLASTLDARGIQATLGYDDRGRILSRSYPDPQENVVYRWDEAASDNGTDRLTSVDDPAGSTRYHYDRDGRLERVEAAIDGVTFTTQYAYTPAGLIASVTYPSGVVATYSRDARGLVERVEVDVAGSPTVLASSASYDPESRLTSLAFGNGLIESRAYDPIGRTSSIAVAGVDHIVYGRDLRGNVTSLDDQLDPSRNQSYGYDLDGRLTSATGPWGTRTFTYDAAGNRLTRTDAGGTATYLYSGNKLTSISGAASAAYTYDAVGNVLSNGIRDYDYSQSGRLEAVSQGGVELASYDYNSLDLRTVKQSAAGTVVYLYDQSGRLIEESDGLGNVLVSYFYLDGWRPLAQLSSGQIHYYHVDNLDTPRVLTDSAQNEVWRGTFYPFGELFQEAGTISPSLRFPGQFRDAEAGLDYNWHRWYEPETGRYSRVDPIGFAGGQTNFYLYARGNPLSYIDPPGLQGCGPSCSPGCSVGPWSVVDVRWVTKGVKEVWSLVSARPFRLPGPGIFIVPRGTGSVLVGCVCRYALSGVYRLEQEYIDYERTIECECAEPYTVTKTEEGEERWTRIGWIADRRPPHRFLTIWAKCVYCPPTLE